MSATGGLNAFACGLPFKVQILPAPSLLSGKALFGGHLARKARNSAEGRENQTRGRCCLSRSSVFLFRKWIRRSRLTTTTFIKAFGGEEKNFNLDGAFVLLGKRSKQAANFCIVPWALILIVFIITHAFHYLC